MDRVLLDDVKLAKTMLIDKKVFEFSGRIRPGKVFSHWDTIVLTQSNGYEVDLLLRLEELNNQRNNNLFKSNRFSISYWISKTPKTAEELLEYNVLAAEGFLDIDFQAEEIVYSEYTRDMEYETDFSIGGHNLLKELENNAGSYLYMMVEF
jgi:hypothetical protein